MVGRPPVVVVGGGIAGLSAAWQLHRDGMPVRLLEADDIVGGKVRVSPFGDRLLDEGADAFLARVPHGTELARELGLEPDLIAPSAGKAMVWTDSGLQRLPEPNVLGIPLDPAAAEAMLGAEARAAIEADLARTEPDPVREGETIGSLVRRRLGDTVHDALVGPLLGAINAGDTDELDLVASSPQILAAAQAGPSLIGVLQRQAASRRSDAPVFHSLPGGMGALTAALGAALADVITTGVTVSAIEPAVDGADGELLIRLGDGETLQASAVVLTVPVAVASVLLERWSAAAELLRTIPTVSVGFVALGFPAGTLGRPRELSGFVVPRTGGLTITACSFTSHKWPHLGDDLEIVRASVGHAGDQTTPFLDDEALIDIVRTDLETTLGLTAEPIVSRITRWPGAFPQYTPGHLDRVAAAEGVLNPDGVFLAGMGYRGIGIPANIDQGRTAGVSAILHVLDDGAAEI